MSSNTRIEVSQAPSEFQQNQFDNWTVAGRKGRNNRGNQKNNNSNVINNNRQNASGWGSSSRSNLNNADQNAQNSWSDVHPIVSENSLASPKIRSAKDLSRGKSLRNLEESILAGSVINPNIKGPQIVRINAVAEKILFSQKSVSSVCTIREEGKIPYKILLDELALRMYKKFKPEFAIDIVENSDGTFTSVDNRRLLIAKKIGKNYDGEYSIWVRVHKRTDGDFSDADWERFNSRPDGVSERNWYRGCKASQGMETIETWGAAADVRMRLIHAKLKKHQAALEEMQSNFQKTFKGFEISPYQTSRRKNKTPTTDAFHNSLKERHKANNKLNKLLEEQNKNRDNLIKKDESKGKKDPQKNIDHARDQLEKKQKTFMELINKNGLFQKIELVESSGMEMVKLEDKIERKLKESRLFGFKNPPIIKEWTANNKYLPVKDQNFFEGQLPKKN